MEVPPFNSDSAPDVVSAAPEAAGRRCRPTGRVGQTGLVVWGERDVLTPTRANVDRYRAAGLTPVIIAGSGHSPMVEKPDEFLAAVGAFVRGR